MPGVRTTHREFDEYVEVWNDCDNVVDGQRAMHKAGERYLRKLTDETPDGYRARLSRADFFNATWRSISGLVGMAFRKDPTVIVPAAIEPYLANIDLAGTTLYTFAKNVTEEVLEYGRMGLLVDHPPLPDNVTAISQAMAERLGLRPTLKLYGPQHIINWRYATIGNATVLAMVVLKEEAELAKSEFEFKCEDRYRVLDLDEAGQYRQRVFRINDKGEDELVGEPIYPQMNGRALGFVPFYIMGTNGIALECDEPPLIDLIDANIAHYQVNADYRHGLHFTGLPTLFLAGVQQDADAKPFYVGSSAAITSPHPDAKGAYIEFTGQGLTPMREALASLEQRMAVLGARMLADETKQVETLGATQIKRTGENSVLASIVIGISQVIESALQVMADWSGAAGDVKFEISREFLPVGMDAQQLTALLANVQAGKISDREYFDLMQRADIIDGAKTFDEHQEEVDAAALPAPLPGVAAA